MPANPRVHKCHGPRVLTGFAYHGYEAVILENEKVRAVINLGRGTHISELVYKPKDLDVLFKNPRGFKHHTGFIPTAYDDKAYHEHHAGGWFECFPNGGAATELGGGKFGFHGELWGTPFEVKEIQESDTHAAVVVEGLTHRAPFKIRKTFSLNSGDSTLSIEEQVTNLGEQEFDVLWGQHPTLGEPFLGADCRLEVAATSYFNPEDEPILRRKWPPQSGENFGECLPRDARRSRFVFVTDFPEGRARVVSPKWKLGFEIEWDAARFPYLWLFENQGTRNAPWFGRARMLAIEPFTGMDTAVKEGHGLLRFAPGETVSTVFKSRFVEL